VTASARVALKPRSQATCRAGVSHLGSPDHPGDPRPEFRRVQRVPPGQHARSADRAAAAPAFTRPVSPTRRSAPGHCPVDVPSQLAMSVSPLVTGSCPVVLAGG